MKSKINRCAIFAITVTLLTAGVLQARIGESKKEITERYGEPTFTHNSATGTYSRHNFQGKTIEVIFVDDEVKIEALHFPREKVDSHERGLAIGKESAEFVISLLTNAYEFSQEKVAEVIENPGRLVGYGKEAAQYNLDYLLIKQEIFSAYLSVQQNEMGDDLLAKCNQTHKAGLRALRAKESSLRTKDLNKKSDGF
jgi:hypothetical protein